jgi:hypothetical protein
MHIYIQIAMFVALFLIIAYGLVNPSVCDKDGMVSIFCKVRLYVCMCVYVCDKDCMVSIFCKVRLYVCMCVYVCDKDCMVSIFC